MVFDDVDDEKEIQDHIDEYIDNVPNRELEKGIEEDVEEPIFDHLMKRFPHWFETIEKMDWNTLKPKRIFKIIYPFVPVIEDGNDIDEKIYVLPISYLDYGNLNIHPCKYVGIKLYATKDDIEKYERSLNKLRDICSNVYNSEKDCVETDPEMKRIIGTIWEERGNRFSPVEIKENKNMIINVDLNNGKIKSIIDKDEKLRGKLDFVESLKKNALQMKEPEKVGESDDGKSLYKFEGSIGRKVAYDVAIERQNYTCIGCGYRPNNIDKIAGTYDEEEGKEEGKILKPHRIVHHCFLGDYDRYNTVILCTKCHDLEFRYFKVYWNRFFENGKLLEWNKLIEESFEFFKEYLVWSHLRK